MVTPRLIIERTGWETVGHEGETFASVGIGGLCRVGVNIGRFNAHVAWYGASINWRGSWCVILSREFPGVTLTLVTADPDGGFEISGCRQKAF